MKIIFLSTYCGTYGFLSDLLSCSLCSVGLNEHECFFIPVSAPCLNIIEEFLAFSYSTHELFPSERSSCLWRRARKTLLLSKCFPRRTSSHRTEPRFSVEQFGQHWSIQIYTALYIPHSAFCNLFHILYGYYTYLNNLHHFSQWIRSFNLFRHRCVSIFSWGVHDLFVLGVCIWGRVSGVWSCPFFQDGWSNFFLYLVLTSCIPAISSSLLMFSLLILSSLVYPLTFLRKQTSTASRRVKSRFVVIHVSLT